MLRVSNFDFVESSYKKLVKSHNMQRLTTIGFIKVGEWGFNNEKFQYNIQDHLEEKDLLYSFICNEEIYYIGKTSGTLRSRMSGYKNARSSQTTNIRVQTQVKKLLESGNSVHIYILPQSAARYHFHQYTISLAAGLEDVIIAAIQPKWNFRGNNRIKELQLPAEDENVIMETEEPIMLIHNSTITKVKLSETYYKGGFFNLAKSLSALFPTEVTDIKIFLGKERSFFIPGKFRFANEQMQPRIWGNTSLKTWFQDNYQINDELTIEILEPTAMCLY